MTDALRDTLTNAGRVLAMEGQGDYVAGHISVRLPDDPERFLMKPAGIGLEEMTPDNIITVGLDGKKVHGTMSRHNEVFIHSEVLRARPEIQAVIHTHPPHAVAFSSLGRPLVPVGNDGVTFSAGLPIFSETTDLIITRERGASVARCLGEHPALILRNHGIVAAARSIEEAVWIALKLEKACRVQLLAEGAGGPKLLAEGEDLKAKRARSNRPDLHANVFNYLVRRWRCQHGAGEVKIPQVKAFEM
jgi:ribulose-5-phosphate 4-epimerase/fuculose-1-phosphate aldolase